MSPNVFPPSGWFSRCLVTVTKRLSQSLLHCCALVVFVVYAYCLSFKCLDTSLVHKSYHWAMTVMFKFRFLVSLQTAMWEPQRSVITLLSYCSGGRAWGRGVPTPSSAASCSVTDCFLCHPLQPGHSCDHVTEQHSLDPCSILFFSQLKSLSGGFIFSVLSEISFSSITCILIRSEYKNPRIRRKIDKIATF